MIYGKTVQIILSAASCGGVIITKNKERAERLRKLADYVCPKFGYTPPRIVEYTGRQNPDDGFKVVFRVIDEKWDKEEKK